MFSETPAWYIIRTARYKEAFVKRLISELVEECYLPFLQTKRPHFGKLLDSTEPLFPCYLFARFSLTAVYHKLTYTPGIRGVICNGGEPCEVSTSIIKAIKDRETNGVVVLTEPRLRPQQRVTVVAGSFRGIDAVFDRYLSNDERVVILLNSVGCTSLKAVLKASSIAPTDSRSGVGERPSPAGAF
jgi:transcriptional antiterminator RfaH